jgi:hypothetical protein
VQFRGVIAARVGEGGVMLDETLGYFHWATLATHLMRLP